MNETRFQRNVSIAASMAAASDQTTSLAGVPYAAASLNHRLAKIIEKASHLLSMTGLTAQSLAAFIERNIWWGVNELRESS